METGVVRLKAEEIVQLLCSQQEPNVMSEHEMRRLLQQYVLLRPNIIDCYRENADDQVATLFRTRSPPTEFLVAQMATKKSAVVISRVLNVLLREYKQEFVPSMVVDFIEKAIDLPGWKCLRGDPALLLNFLQYVHQYVLETEEKSRERAFVLKVFNDVLKKCIGDDRAIAQRTLPPIFEHLYSKLHRMIGADDDLGSMDRKHAAWKDIYESVGSVFTESSLHKRSKLPSLVDTFYREELEQKAQWTISDFFELVHLPTTPKSKAVMDSVRAQLVEFVRCHPSIFGNQLPLLTNNLRTLLLLNGRQARQMDAYGVVHSSLDWINAAIPHVFKCPAAFDAFVEIFLEVSYAPTSGHWQETMDKVAELIKVYSYWHPKEARSLFNRHHDTFLALYHAFRKMAPALKNLVETLNPREVGK